MNAMKAHRASTMSCAQRHTQGQHSDRATTCENFIQRQAQQMITELRESRFKATWQSHFNHDKVLQQISFITCGLLLFTVPISFLLSFFLCLFSGFCLSFFLAFFLSFCLFCLFLSLFISRFLFLSLSLCLSLSLSVSISISTSISTSINLNLKSLSLFLSGLQSICLCLLPRSS